MAQTITKTRLYWTFSSFFFEEVTEGFVVNNIHMTPVRSFKLGFPGGGLQVGVYKLLKKFFLTMFMKVFSSVKFLRCIYLFHKSHPH